MSFGLLSAAGVFTSLIAVGLVPRFAGKTHTADYIWWYEELVIVGSICGMLFSVFESLHKISSFFLHHFALELEIVFGFFTGCFVGCLALSIAETLDSIPIFARRIRLEWGVGIAIFFAAMGKAAGAIMYYTYGIGVAQNGIW